MNTIAARDARLGGKLPDGDYETLSGFILDRMQRIPKRGERLYFDRYVFDIVKASPRQIEEIQISMKNNAAR